MSEKNEQSTLGNFVIGLVIGSLVGAAVGLILAPQSGDETRQAFLTEGIELKDRAGDQAGEARRRAEDMATSAREEVRRRAEELQQQAASKLHRDGPGGDMAG